VSIMGQALTPIGPETTNSGQASQIAQSSSVTYGTREDLSRTPSGPSANTMGTQWKHNEDGTGVGASHAQWPGVSDVRGNVQADRELRRSSVSLQELADAVNACENLPAAFRGIILTLIGVASTHGTSLGEGHPILRSHHAPTDTVDKTR